MIRLSLVSEVSSPGALFALKVYISNDPSVLLSARFAAQTYRTPDRTTVIATIRIVAITGLTAFS